MIKNIINWILGPKKEIKYIVNCADENKESNVSIIELISKLESRIENLEQENINNTNSLYEIENTLQAQIDKINLSKYNH